MSESLDYQIAVEIMGDRDPVPLPFSTDFDTAMRAWDYLMGQEPHRDLRPLLCLDYDFSGESEALDAPDPSYPWAAHVATDYIDDELEALVGWGEIAPEAICTLLLQVKEYMDPRWGS